MKWYRSISVRIVLCVGVMVLLVNGALACICLYVQEKSLSFKVLQNASQLSETIRNAIRNDMLENRKEAAYRIMDTVGRQEGIERVRIYSPEGRILFSTDAAETGRMVNQQAEACFACHSEARPLEHLEMSERSRVFFSTGRASPSGPEHRVLGIISPLYNEPACSSAACHAHPGSTRVLGVIDLTMDLSAADAMMASGRGQILLVGALSIAAVCVIVALILFRFLARPIRELVLATRRISGGDLDHPIPAVTADELGVLTASFNQMTRDLREARVQVQEGIRNLEQKVEERTSDLKDAQSQLLKSEKLAAVGALAATVAHEINNPLSGIYTFVRLMERKIGQGQHAPADFDTYRRYLDAMRRELERTTAIVQNLLDFTRPKEPVRKQVNLTEIVLDVLSVIQSKLDLNNVEVVNRMQPLPDITADPGHMKQVFINLLINACEAMEQGGTLTISCQADAAVNAVAVDVRDTGAGIEPENLARIFEPFFSTRDKGTGLGLAVVNGIVKRHKGRVEIESAPGKGTRFRIVLPIS